MSALSDAAIRRLQEAADAPDLSETKYELVDRIAQGGMGTVFKARQKSLDRIVALKILPPSIAKNERYIERFQREARASAKLDHPNIVMGIDVGKDPKLGLWYFAMEYLPAGDLHKAVLDGKIKPRDVVPLISKVAEALSAAHAKSYVHRDVKPHNILLDAAGEPKLTDFDLVAHPETTGGTTGGGLGDVLEQAFALFGCCRWHRHPCGLGGPWGVVRFQRLRR